MRQRARIPLAQRARIMQPQRFDVGDDQPALFARRDRFAERGDIAAGEDIFAREGVGRAGFTETADGVEQHHAVGGHQIGAGAKEGFEIGGADMFEHAHRHDPVETPDLALGKVAIVDQLEAHPVGHTRRRGAFAGERELFFGQGDAQHLDPFELREGDRHAAPAAADIEHALLRRERQLGRDMRLFRRLSLLQRHVGARPIGAAILHVAVEKEAVEVVADVVMMRDIRARRAPAIDRIEPRLHPLDPFAERGLVLELCAAVPWRVRAQQADQLHDIALHDLHLAVHEGFGGAEPRIEDDAAHPLSRGKTDRHFGIAGGRRAEAFAAPVRRQDGQLAVTDDAGQERAENGHGCDLFLRLACPLRPPKYPHTIHNQCGLPRSRPSPPPPCRGWRPPRYR